MGIPQAFNWFMTLSIDILGYDFKLNWFVVIGMLITVLGLFFKRSD